MFDDSKQLNEQLNIGIACLEQQMSNLIK